MSACILCIEDEATLLGDLVDELNAAGYRVIAANSAEQALLQLEQQRPDLVLCDVMLGGDSTRDGYFIHRYIREQRPDLADLPFILLTALGQRNAQLEAKRLGVDDYLVKPVDYDMLLATVGSRLAQVERLRGYARSNQNRFIEHLQSIFSQLPGAVLLCDPDGQLLYANPKAQRLALEEGIWAQDSRGRLSWLEVKPSALRTFRQYAQELHAGVGERRVLALERASSAGAVFVSLLSLAPGTPPLSESAGNLLAIFLSSAQSRSLPELETLRLIFALTPTEARVALLLAQGRRSDEVALELDVSASTVAFHLRNLFAKTGVARQADLVALVLSAGSALPDLSMVVETTA
ncbi:response regulator [Pseudomonas sp. GWSMS-1]|uniref:response regulator n=1 Tax=Pseudomonas sp. GWSMS-1 TaxID=3308997 RepID=UPI003CE8640C